MDRDNLKAWDVSEKDYPSRGSIDEQIRFLLRYAVLAPSGPNTQPWKFSLNGDSLMVMADFSRALPFVEPNNRTMYISLGCVLTNIMAAAEHFNLGYDIHMFPQGTKGEKIARVVFGGENKGSGTFMPLFPQITKRHTNRTSYEQRPIDSAAVQAMKDAVSQDGFHLSVMTDAKGKDQMADLLGRSHKIQLGNKSFRKDLARWIRSNTSDAYDGLPGYSFGYSDFESYFGSFIFGAFDTSTSRAQKEMGLMRESPAVAVLSTDREDKGMWVETGIVFERLFLTATAVDVRFDLFSQPIAIDELRAEMASILGLPYPQILIRMGYAPPAKHTPRRPVDQVLVSQAN